MARTKDETAEWENYRDELKSLWLDKRWTLKQVQEYMSQAHNFCKSWPFSESQFTRQLNRWGFKKNLTDAEWNFVARRGEKRKREGKEPGPVRLHGRLIPEPKVRKETSRHSKLSSQYVGDLDPPTPDGVVVGTPRADIESIPDASLDWLQIGNFDFLNLEGPSPATLNHGDVALQFQLPEPIPSDFGLHSQWFEQPAVLFNINEFVMEHQAMHPVVSPSVVAKDDGNWHSSDHKMVEETLQILLEQFDARGGRGHGDLILALEPVTSGADTKFQFSSPTNISNYLQMCVYLASNNLLAEASTRQLVSLIAKFNSHSRLKALVDSNSTSNEIFMSTLLASAAAEGDARICQVLIEAGADLDALSGMTTRTTPLRRAIRNLHPQCTKMLLEAGADPNLVVERDTPLHNACENSYFRPALDIVNQLLRHGAHVNPPQDCARLTPLQHSASAIQPEVLKLLLDNGADPNVFTTSKSGTALQIACGSSSNANVVEVLMNAGADIDKCSGYRFSNRDEVSSADSDTDSSSSSDLDDWTEGSGLPISFKPPILIAAEEENWEAVQLLLEEGAAINTRLKKCPPEALEEELDATEIAVFTPLQAAVRAENITMTRMLLVNGADINMKVNGNHGHTALQIAAMVGSERLIGILLRKGADINSPAGLYCGRTALQAAATHSDTRILSLLLVEGADVNASPARFHGRTALQTAIAAGNIEGVRILLHAGAIVNTDPDLTDGVTCLQEAFKITDQAVKNEVVHLLLRAGAAVGAPKSDQQRHAPLHAAVNNQDLGMIRKLLERGASPNIGFDNLENQTPLQKASSLGNNDIVQELIKHGAEVNASPYTFRGRTALQAACEGGHESTAKILLSFGAAIKAERAGVDGVSAIEASLNSNNFGLTQLFLDKEPNAISSDPVTSRQIIGRALDIWNCNVSLLELLIRGGADVGKAPNLESRSYLHIAAAKGNFEMVQCLILAGTNINHRWKKISGGEVTALQSAVASRNIDIVKLLLERGADVNAPADEHGGQTALQIAASQDYHSMVKLLKDHGADVNGLPSPIRGRSALQEAASRGFMQLTKYLLASGANPNLPPARFGGVTALQGAAIEGKIRIVIMLLQAGALVNALPAIVEGRSAIEGAAENGRLDTLRLLLKYHPDTEEFDIRRKRAARLALSNGHLAIGRFLMAYRKHAWKA
ncbi:hypothetical protein N7494_001133 [Penicillium frequentans]|uniref:Clr5 domain-containing protein n=1 Tax=Penicillium frequentans TaxID=3151616 RepID=A0AAD6D880_9EURO|nr:hypothetical protein N7494_001133 [Penicillium glabrum]